jgi:hypothetical protein
VVAGVVPAPGEVEADVRTVGQGGVAAPADPVVGGQLAGALGLVEEQRLLQGLAVVVGAGRAGRVDAVDDGDAAGEEAEETGRVRDPMGSDRIGFGAKAVIDRKDFGLTFNQALDAGGMALGDRVEIAIDVEAVRAAQAAA